MPTTDFFRAVVTPPPVQSTKGIDKGEKGRKEDDKGWGRNVKRNVERKVAKEGKGRGKGKEGKFQGKWPRK